MLKEKLPFLEDRCGYLFFADYHSLTSRMHTHEALELNIVVQGSVTYLIDEKHYHLNAGSCLWIFEQQAHMIVDAAPDLSLLIVVYKQGSIKEKAQSSWVSKLKEIHPDRVFCRVLHMQQVKESVKIANSLIDAEHLLEFQEAGLFWLLFSVWKSFTAAEEIVGNDCHSLVRRVLDLIQEDPTIQVVKICEKIHTSRGYISGLFHDQMGLTIPEFRNRVRLEQFFENYQTSRNILDCALDSGFGSYAQFYRVFLKMTGKTPRTFLNEHNRPY